MSKNKKLYLIFSILAFCISLILIGVVIYLIKSVPENYNQLEDKHLVSEMQNRFDGGIICIVFSALLMVLSHFLIMLENNFSFPHSVLSKIMYCLTFIQFWVIAGIICLGYKIWDGITNGDWSSSRSSFDSSSNKEERKTIYADGFTTTLTRNRDVYKDGSYHQSYTDDIGHTWISDDNGKTVHK